jgi:hypothetical protein
MSMRIFLITVKLPKNPEHDPKNKVTGKCPLSTNSECTDVTGQHHTIMNQVNNHVTADMIKESWTNNGMHVTRIEEVHTYVSVV